ncbi:MAG: protein-glutamate O-methyltransferase CheR [Melioribacteraceae bacterium]|nr:protein-glutamate O-methyltransferase CheR [Melioribacteraceae bacterium]
MSLGTFERWREFIYNSCGIYFQDNKKYLLESRLLKRLNHLKLNTYEEYLDYINQNSKKSFELKELFETITINETFFFRNQPQMDALGQKIIPDIIKSKASGLNKKVRIWSAASSSGEEAYSIAILINELIKPKFPDFAFEIIGTDISNDVLQKARSGIYKEYAVRNIPIFYLKKYFERQDNEFILDPKIKSMVRFNELNLYDDFKMRTMINFDVIFCANVLIYFDTKSKVKVVNHLYNSLNKNGYLFIGYSETLHGVSQAFKLESFPKTIGYKKI